MFTKPNNTKERPLYRGDGHRALRLADFETWPANDDISESPYSKPITPLSISGDLEKLLKAHISKPRMDKYREE